MGYFCGGVTVGPSRSVASWVVDHHGSEVRAIAWTAKSAACSAMPLVA